jgi:hypothetical protein
MSNCPHRLNNGFGNDRQIVEENFKFGRNALEYMISLVNKRIRVSAMKECLQKSLNHWEEVLNKTLMFLLHGSEESDNNNKIKVCNILSLF